MKKLSAFTFILLIMISFSARSEETPALETETAASNAELVVQEIKYVTDKLRLSLYKQADSGTGTIKLLVSGDKLEVLGRSGPYSHVRTAQGQIGWVKNGFLVSTPTASNQLQDMQQKIEQMKAELAKYSDSQKMVQQYEAQLQALKQEKESLNQQLEQTQQSEMALKQQSEQLSNQLQRLTSTEKTFDWRSIEQMLIQFWYVVLIVFLLAFFIGMIIGRKIIEARVNRRFQGVKVL